jgi:fibronectin type 3 domain-containing protein
MRVIFMKPRITLLIFILFSLYDSAKAAERIDLNVISVFPPTTGLVSSPIIKNGSFETGDYTGWTLLEDYPPDGGIWGIAYNGQVINPGDQVHDFSDNIMVQIVSTGLPKNYYSSDGKFVAFQSQTYGQNHRMYQDISLPINTKILEWDMSYNNLGIFFLFNQKLNINIRDLNDNIIETIFVTDGTSPPEISMTRFTKDISRYAGNTIRLDVEMIVHENYFDAEFDNFSIVVDNIYQQYPVNSNININFNQQLNPSSVLSDSIQVFGSESGQINGKITYMPSLRTLIFDPESNFLAFETISVDLKVSIQSLSGDELNSNYAWSFTADGSLDDTPPSSVSNLISGDVPNDTENKILLSWSANEELDFSYYEIYRSNSAITTLGAAQKIGAVFLPEYIDATAEIGSNYYYAVISLDKSGNYNPVISSIGPVNATDHPPAVPTNITFNDSDDGILISWSQNSESDLAGYKIYYGSEVIELPPRDPKGLPINNFIDKLIDVGNINSFNLVDIEQCKNYSIGISSYDLAGNESTVSPRILVNSGSFGAPSAPNGIAASTNNGLINIIWNFNIECDISRYHIYRSTALDGEFVEINVVEYWQNSITDTSVVNGVEYFYKIIAEDNFGTNSQPSNIVSEKVIDLTPPNIPYFYYPYTTLDGISLYWHGNNDYTNDLAGYKIYFGTTSTSLNQSMVFESTDGNWNENEITNLQNCTIYYFFVSAFDLSGNESQKSNIMSIRNDSIGAPSAVGNINGISTEGLISINWSASSECDFSRYEVYRSSSFEGPFELIGNTNYSNYQDYRIANNITYFYKITSVDRYGLKSSYSDIFSIEAIDNIVPLVPSTPYANISLNGIRISWYGNNYNSRDLAGYKIYYGTSSKDYVDSVFFSTSYGSSINYNLTGIEDCEIYFIAISAIDISGHESDLSGELSFKSGSIGPPSPPIQLSTLKQDGLITLQWDQSPDCDTNAYEVYRSTTYDGNYLLVQTTNSSIISFQDRAIANGTRYFYKVRAKDITGLSGEFSEIVSEVALDTIAPIEPYTDSYINRTPSGIRIYWYGNNSNKDLAGYKIYYGTSSNIYPNVISVSSSNSGTNYYTLSLNNCTTFYYAVSAIDLSGNESILSNQSSFTSDSAGPPAAPVGLNATVANGSITIQWNANIECDVQYYYIFRSTSLTGIFSQVDSLYGKNNTTYQDKNLVNGLTYFYKVKTYDATGLLSDFSETVFVSALDTTPPNRPLNLAASPSTNGIYLNWTGNNSEVPDLAGYKIYYRTSEGSYTTINYPYTYYYNYSYLLSGLAPCTDYNFKVSAYDNSGNESTFSNDIIYNSGQPGDPTAPIGLNVTSVDGKISLNWTQNTECDHKEYYVYRSLNNSSFSSIATLNSTSYEDNKIANGVTYYYKIRARDLAGATSPYSQTVSGVGIDTSTPNKPTYVTSVSSYYYIRVSWANNSEPDISQYKIYYGTSSGNYQNSRTTSGLNTDFYNLQSCTKYYFAVSAIDLSGHESALSTETSSVYQGSSSLQPPSGLNASSANSVITLNWNANTECDISGYRVYRSTTSGSGYTEIGAVYGTTTFQDRKVANGVRYYYTVKAFNHSNVLSNYSAQATADGIDTQPPQAPSYLDLGIGGTSISAYWEASASPDVKEYRVYTHSQGGQYGVPLATSSTNISIPNPGNCHLLYVAIKAVDFSGLESSFSQEKSIQTYLAGAPTVPTGFSGVINLDKVSLVWQANAECDVTAYRIYRSMHQGAGYQMVGTTQGTNFNDAGLPENTTFYYVIRAVDSENLESVASTQISLTIPDYTPPVFTIDQYDPSAPTATQTLSGSKEPGCIVKLNGTVVFTENDQNNTWSYEVTLIEGIATRLVFIASDAAENKTVKTVDLLFDASPPPALGPGVLTADGSGNGNEITLQWPTYQNQEPADLAYYRVYYSTSGFSDISEMTVNATVDHGVLTYAVKGLVGGTTTYFAVVPVDLAGNFEKTIFITSTYPVDTVPPADVKGLTARAEYTANDSNSIILTWNASSDAGEGGDLVDQILYVDNGSGYPDSGISLGREAITYTVSGLNDATLYKFKLVTKDATNPESKGVLTQAVTRLTNPANLIAQPGKNQVTLRWAAVSSPLLKSYRIYRLPSVDTLHDVRSMNLIRELTNVTFTDTALSNGTTYQYAVTTVNTSNLENLAATSIAAIPRQDAEGPAIGTFNLMEGQVVSAPLTIQVKASDTESAMGSIELHLDGNLVKSSEGDSLSWLWNVVDATDGKHLLKVVAYDEPGNATEAERNIFVSLAAPAIPKITAHVTESSAPTYTVKISGIDAPLFSTVTLKLDDAVVGQAAATSDGKFVFSGIALIEGENRLAVRATHRGGDSPYSLDYIVTVDTGPPPAPQGLSAKALAGGTVQFAWQAGMGEVPTGFNLYGSQTPFSDISDAGVTLLYTSIRYLFKEIIPADDNERYYAVTALDGALNESPISNVVSVAADRGLPQVTAVTFAADGGEPKTQLTAGPGTIEATITVNEPLQELPFFSLEPQVGSPIVISMTKMDDLHYSGTFQVGAASPHGPTVWKFSGKDIIGNRGSKQGAGPILDVQGPVATISAPVLLQQLVTAPVAVSLTFDETPVGTPMLELVAADGVAASVTGLAPSGDGRNWSGVIDLASLAEGEGTFRLIEARDVFANLGTTIAEGGRIFLYSDTPPAPSAPQGLVAKSEKGGQVVLTWNAVNDSVSYNLYRRPEGEPTFTKIASVNPRTFTNLPGSDGVYFYVVSAVGPLGTESAHGAEVEALSDRTPPIAPTGLSVSLSGNGVRAVWGDPVAEAPALYRLYRSATPIATLTGLTPIAASGSTAASDPSPSTSARYYAVTALDALGNESTPSASVQLQFPVAPVSSLLLSRVEGGNPTISWTDSGVAGFYIYRNGSRINAAPTPGTSFTDGYYAGGNVTYGVSAVDSDNNESPIREVSLPQLSIGIREGIVLRRGVLETIPVVLTSNETLEVAEIKVKIGSGTESILGGPFSLQSGEELVVNKVAAAMQDTLSSVAAVCSARIEPAPGTTILITQTSQAQVSGAGAAFEVFNESLVRGTSAKVRLKVNNIGSAPMEFLTSQNGGPTGEVTVYLRDQDGNLLAQGSLSQRTGSAVVNANGYASARLAPGASFLSEPITFNVPSNAPAKVLIDARIANTYYHYGWPDQVIAPGFRQTVQAAIAEVAYSATAVTDKPVYRQGEMVLITGTAISSATGESMPHVPVKIGVSTKGFDRFYAVSTDENGNFSQSFTPAATEAGTFSIWAVHPDLNDRNVQAAFDIIGLAVTPNIYNLSMPRGQSFDVPVNLRNLGDAEITGLTFATAASTGITAALINNGDNKLTGGENQGVSLRVTSSSNAPQTGFATLNIGTEAGLSARVDVNINMVTLIPIISINPSFIDTGMMRGTQKIQSFTIHNSGLGALRGARLEGPSIPWMQLTVDRNLGDVAPGSSVPIGIMLRPDQTLSPGVYDDRIIIISDNHIPYTFNIQVTVTSDAVGSVYFDVQNELYEKLSDASIVLQHQQLLDLRYNLKTGAGGTVMLNDIAEGRYTYNVSAPGALPYSGTFVIEPGLTTTVAVALEVNMVDIEWSVVPTAIQDKYEIKITQTFETNVPAPVIITEPAGITLPPMQPGEVFNGEFTVKNYGLIAVFDVQINFPTSFEDYDVEVLTEAVPKRIEAMQTIRVPYRVTRRVQTASTKSIFEEMSGFGGGDCFRAVSFGIKCKYIICPNTPTERVAEKFVNYVISYIPDYCPPSGGGGFGGGGWTIYGGGGGGGGSQSGGGGYPGTATGISTSNPCDCKEEGSCLGLIDGEYKKCQGGEPEIVKINSVDAKVEGKIDLIRPFGPGDSLNLSFTSFADTQNCDPDYKWSLTDGETYSQASFTKNYQKPSKEEVTLEVSCKNCSPPAKRASVRVQLVNLKSLSGGGKVVLSNDTKTPTLLVKKGSSLTFTVEKDPIDSDWPQGYPIWRGSSGANGSTESITINFDDVSSSRTDYKTVEVECGNKLKIDVLVYELVMGIHSSVNDPSTESFSDGHAWISFINFETNRAMTYGLWPDDHRDIINTPDNNGDGSDVRIGREPLMGEANRFYAIFEDQRDLFLGWVTSVFHWHYVYTCASWASETIKYITGEDVDADDNALGFETPREIIKSINALEVSDPSSISQPTIGAPGN